MHPLPDDAVVASRFVARPRTVDDEQILAAAAQAVGEVGPARLTLADVGRRVGLSAPALVLRFGSKRGLLLALAAYGSDAMPAAVRGAADADDPLGALVAVLTEFAAAVREPATYANHLAFLLLDLADPDFQALSRRHTEAVAAAVSDVLGVAAARDLLPPRTDTDGLARLVHAVYNGALVTWGMAPDGEPQAAVAARLRAVLDLAGRR